jgi:hypothetical protein
VLFSFRATALRADTVPGGSPGTSSGNRPDSTKSCSTLPAAGFPRCSNLLRRACANAFKSSRPCEASNSRMAPQACSARTACPRYARRLSTTPSRSYSGALSPRTPCFAYLTSHRYPGFCGNTCCTTSEMRAAALLRKRCPPSCEHQKVWTSTGEKLPWSAIPTKCESGGLRVPCAKPVNIEIEDGGETHPCVQRRLGDPESPRLPSYSLTPSHFATRAELIPARFRALSRRAATARLRRSSAVLRSR